MPRIIYNGWVMVFVTFITIFMTLGSQTAFSVFFIPLTDEFSWSVPTISLAMSINLIVSGLSLPIVGRLVDRYGPKIVMLFGTSVIGLSYLLLGLITSIWQFYLLFGILIGFNAASIGTIAATSLIARWFVEKRGKAMSIYSSGFPLGQLLIVPLMSYITIVFNWRTAWFVQGLFFLVVVFPLVLIFVKNQPKDLPSSDKVGKIKPRSSVLFKEAIRSRTFFLLIGIYAICGFTDIPMTTHWIPFSLELGFSPIIAANALGLMGIFVLLGTITMGPISDRFGRKNPLATFYFIRFLSLICVLSFGSYLEAYWVYTILFGFSMFGMNPLVSSLLGDVYGEKILGKLLGVVLLTHTLLAAFGSFLFGLIFDLSGSYYNAFLISIVLAFMAGILSLLLKSK